MILMLSSDVFKALSEQPMAAPASLQTLCLQFVCPEVADEVPHLLEVPKGEEADMLKRNVHGVLSSFIELNRFYINVLVMNGYMWSRAPCNFLALAPLQSWSFRASWVLEGFHTPTFASCFGMFIDCCSWRFRRFDYQAFAKTHIWRCPVSWVNLKTCHCTSEKTWTRLYSSNPHKRSRLRLLVWLLQSHWLSEWGMTCHDLSTFSPPSRKFKWSKSLKG